MGFQCAQVKTGWVHLKYIQIVFFLGSMIKFTMFPSCDRSTGYMVGAVITLHFKPSFLTHPFTTLWLIIQLTLTLICLCFPFSVAYTPFLVLLFMLYSHIRSSLSILSPSQLHDKTHQFTQDLWTTTLWARLKIYWTRLCLRWYKSHTPLCPTPVSYTPLCPLPPVLPFPWNSPPIISSKALPSCPTLSFRPQDLTIRTLSKC